MSTQLDHAATIHVGNHDITIQMFAISEDAQADWQCPGIAVQDQPVPLAAWPIDPADLARVAAAKLTACGGIADRKDDCLWAATHSDVVPQGYYAREARTPKQRDADQAKARRAYLRGDLS